MQLTLEALAVVAVLELLLFVPFLWRVRRPLALILFIGLAGFSIILLATWLSAWTVVLLFFSLYRMVNLWRIIKQRVQIDYLYNSARRASVWLILVQVLVWAAAVLSRHYGWHTMARLWLLASTQVVVAIILLLTASRSIKAIQPDEAGQPIAAADLPTLTVAIPARNETVELEDCLQSLLASTYPKLEIVVLDDCSQNKRTPEIIRGFAQQGIRFIPGNTPPESWLAKNFAYKQLAEVSNGEVLLFCGVDTRFEPNSLTNLVETLVNRQKNMLCVLPFNDLANSRKLLPLLIQPFRYAWELALPRQLLSRPPVLSTCWLIKREALLSVGGFDAVSRKIIPESYFARQMAATPEGYSFVAAGGGLAVTSRKSFGEQRDTAIRTRYPQLHKRLELVGLLSLIELWLLVWPIFGFVAAVLNHSWLLAVVSIIGYSITAGLNARIAGLTYRRKMTASLWSLPLAALYDIGLLNYSLWQYEFSEVLWKGRNVCIPVMRTIAALPEPTSN